MRKTNQIKQKVFKLTLADKAFVYQQAYELDQPVMISINREKDIYNVIFVVNTSNEKLQIVGKGKNLIEACLKAKQKAQEKISIRPKNFNYEEREALVDILKHNIYIH